jgi:hypothetical protein
MLKGFAVAMQPSLGLVGCSEATPTPKTSTKLSCEANRGNKSEGLQFKFVSPCDFGFGFLHDRSGVHFVKTLLPEGPYQPDFLNFVSRIPFEIALTRETQMNDKNVFI